MGVTKENVIPANIYKKLDDLINSIPGYYSDAESTQAVDAAIEKLTSEELKEIISLLCIERRGQMDSFKKAIEERDREILTFIKRHLKQTDDILNKQLQFQKNSKIIVDQDGQTLPVHYQHHLHRSWILTGSIILCVLFGFFYIDSGKSKEMLNTVSGIFKDNKEAVTNTIHSHSNPGEYYLNNYPYSNNPYKNNQPQPQAYRPNSQYPNNPNTGYNNGQYQGTYNKEYNMQQYGQQQQPHTQTNPNPSTNNPSNPNKNNGHVPL